jgi:predicted RND superfamily exporter protein
MPRASGSRWALVLALSVAVTLAAAWFASRLGFDTQLVDLLPDGLEAASDYKLFLEEFGGIERVYVAITSDPPLDPETLADAAGMLADELAASELVSSARSGLEEIDESFYLDHYVPRAFLVADPETHETLVRRLEPEAIRERVATMREALAGPAGLFLASVMAADPLGFSEETGGLDSGQDAIPIDPFTGAFLSEDGSTTLVVVTPASAELDSEAGRALSDLLNGSFEIVREEIGAPLTFHAVGGPLYAVQDESILRTDIARTVTGSALGVALLLVLYFSGVRLPVALLLGVFAGILWTAGLVGATVGSISVIGMAFAAVLVGLGVDYGIHVATRFRQACLEGLDRSTAMLRSFRETGPAILASVVTTAVAFLVLSLTHFRPVRELGLLVAVGIVSILLASVGIGASTAVLWPPLRLGRGERPGGGPFWKAVGRVVNGTIDLGTSHPRLTVAVTVMLSAVAAFGITRIEFSADLRTFRPEFHPALAAEELLVEKFSFGLDTFTVVLKGDDPGDLFERASRVKRVMTDALPNLSAVSPSDWLVEGSALVSRVELWRGESMLRAVETLETELERQRFEPAAFAPAIEMLRSVAEGVVPPPVARDAWPDWLAELVRIDDDGVTAAVRVRTPHGEWPDGPPPEVIAAMREVDPDAAVASAARLGVEVRGLVGREFRRLGGWCLLAIGTIVLLSFRGRIPLFALAMLPVLVGSFVLVGVCGAVGVVMTPLSMAVAPVLLGIGVDDGLHAVHGSRVHGGLVASLRRVGPAMTLTTLTTAVAFGSLMLSSIPALQNAGLLVALGAVLCLVATLAVLPALGTWIGGRGTKETR